MAPMAGAGGPGDVKRCDGRLRRFDESSLLEVVPVAEDPDTGPTCAPRPWPWRDCGRMWSFGFVLLPKIDRC